MKLVRDVLDKQLVDRHGQPCGKVDGLVLVIEEGLPPRLAAIECGFVVLARRIGRRVSRVVEWLAARVGPRHGEVLRIPWSRVRSLHVEVEVDLDAERSELLAGERWARRRVIARIPGA